MNLLVLSTIFVLFCIAVESKYPYEETYRTEDMPSGYGIRHRYDRYRYRPREYGEYPYAAYERNNRYGRNRDVLYRHYRRRYNRGYLPPRGIGDYDSYEYRRGRKPRIHGPPKHYDDGGTNYGGYN